MGVWGEYDDEELQVMRSDCRGKGVREDDLRSTLYVVCGLAFCRLQLPQPSAGQNKKGVPQDPHLLLPSPPPPLSFAFFLSGIRMHSRIKPSTSGYFFGGII